MACKSYNKSWETEFLVDVCTKDRVQDNNFNQLKLKVNDSYKKDERLTTNFEPSKDEDVITKSYLDPKCFKKEGHITLVEKDFTEFKLKNTKQPVK